MFKIRLSRRSEGYIRRADKNAQSRIVSAIESIRSNPLEGQNIKPLIGSKAGYRYRVGDLRMLYTVHFKDRLIDIISIGPRGDAYK